MKRRRKRLDKIKREAVHTAFDRVLPGMPPALRLTA